MQNRCPSGEKGRGNVTQTDGDRDGLGAQSVEGEVCKIKKSSEVVLDR